MRLTLRTLLSYLDDTLEPSQAKAIGAKVAESEQARDLMERIKQVTRRRRLTTPPTTGPGGMDANTIADYLDNEVTPETAAEVEQICLASDVHLAEVAACHQILTLVLGEPALVPPSAKQRMYGLVKGPESIPFRKPAKPTSKDDDDLSSEIEPDQDETLRLGMTGVGSGGNSRNFALAIGGGVLVVCLLGFAVWELTREKNPIVPGPKPPDPIAQLDKKDKDADQTDKKTKPPEITDKKNDKTQPPKKDPDDKKNDTKVEDFKVDPPREVPYAAANNKQQPVGKYLAPDFKDPGVLLQHAGKGASPWKRLVDKNAPVISGTPLVSLSGSKSVINLEETDIELTLWGNLPEVTLDETVLESRVVLHLNPLLDADLTLERGRIILRNKKMTGKDALVRVRFHNPTLSSEEHLDITLEGSGSAVILERFSDLNREDPFQEDPKERKREGPIAYLRIFAFEHTAYLRFGGEKSRLHTTNQPMMQWRSLGGILGPPERVTLPPWFGGTPPLDKEKEKLREKAVAAHRTLAAAISDKKPVGVALLEILTTVQENAPKEILASKQVSVDTFSQWRHAIRCYGATDEISRVVEQFGQERTHPFIRLLCIQTIQRWLAIDRNQDYALLAILQGSYRKTESVKIMELLHYVSSEEARKPEKYERLIEGLNNDLLLIRALSHYHLMVLAPPQLPAGSKIPLYDPDMQAPARRAAVLAWQALIPPGQLPGSAAPPAGKDKK